MFSVFHPKWLFVEGFLEFYPNLEAFFDFKIGPKVREWIYRAATLHPLCTNFAKICKFDQSGCRTKFNVLEIILPYNDSMIMYLESLLDNISSQAKFCVTSKNLKTVKYTYKILAHYVHVRTDVSTAFDTQSGYVNTHSCHPIYYLQKYIS